MVSSRFYPRAGRAGHDNRPFPVNLIESCVNALITNGAEGTAQGLLDLQTATSNDLDARRAAILVYQTEVWRIWRRW
ncbi:MAG: hypothetical protein M1511_08625 [Deltaproteobacteria bacterium]|nr:hypothetical protein [Deltaproteobacteria bacterium]